MTLFPENLADRQNNVCFSGHRPAKLPCGGDRSQPAMAAIERRLLDEIENAVKAGKSNFLHGMMAGFDIVAAEAVLRVKEIYPDIHLVSVFPFGRGFWELDEWGKNQKDILCEQFWQKRALKAYKNSDRTKVLEAAYSKGVYYRRNRWLVDHASLLICYCNSGRGGTKMTRDYAEKCGVPIINLNE